MSELTLPSVASTPVRRAVGRALITMAWRNLWRVPRRTWLTAGGVGFAILLVVFSRSIQIGALDSMLEVGTAQLTGHAQVQHPDYLDDPRMRSTVAGLAALTGTLAGHPDVQAVAPRGMGFGLVSDGSGERSFGGQITGIDPAVEFATLASQALPGGRPVERAGEGFMGSKLARNIGVAPGDDIIVLGTGTEGGVAAMAVTLVGLFESGIPDLDRGFLMVHFDDFAEAFGLEDEAHVIAVLTGDPRDARALAADLAAMIVPLDGNAAVRPWQELMPILEQSVVGEIGGSALFAGFLVVIVTFVVVSTFVMTVFERTAEFGMLKAIGMAPAAIFRMVQLEGFWMSLMGVALGVVASLVFVYVSAIEGIPFSAFGDFDDMMDRFFLPDVMMPRFDSAGALLMTAMMVVAVQVAAAIPARRIWRLNPVEALRAEE
ncbi:MAG: ABC transporter permease [Gammaproteobacteria bacterium]|nr:ABC transporter permease [Gammaproteobacteria bacterium]